MSTTPRPIPTPRNQLAPVPQDQHRDQRPIDASHLPRLDVEKAYAPSVEPFGRVGIFRLRRGRVTLSLSTHLGGAIYKFSYDGVEFVKPVAIVGASMQSAVALDIPKGGSAELLNPTEAGNAELDSNTGKKSSSKMLEIRASDNAVYTSTQAAYFRKPGIVIRKQPGGVGMKVINSTVVSDVIMRKMLTFVDDRTLEYKVEMDIPTKYSRAIITVVACWVPWTSSTFMWALDANGRWGRMAEGPKYDKGKAIVVSDGKRAMGVACVEAPPDGERFFKRLDKQGAWRKWSLIQTSTRPRVLTWSLLIRFGTPGDVKSFFTKHAK